MIGARVDILAVGKLNEAHWTAACAEYAKRLQRYIKLHIAEVRDQGARTEHDIAQARTKEADLLRARLDPNSYVIALDSSGKQLSSEDLAAELLDLQDAGHGHLSFIIGGSWGIDESLLSQASMKLSLGKMTLPHNLARVVLLEQIYRACKIIKSEPYHK